MTKVYAQELLGTRGGKMTKYNMYLIGLAYCSQEEFERYGEIRMYPGCVKSHCPGNFLHNCMKMICPCGSIPGTLRSLDEIPWDKVMS